MYDLMYVPVRETENARAVKGDGRHDDPAAAEALLDVAAIREAIGRKVRAIEAMVMCG